MLYIINRDDDHFDVIMVWCVVIYFRVEVRLMFGRVFFCLSSRFFSLFDFNNSNLIWSWKWRWKVFFEMKKFSHLIVNWTSTQRHFVISSSFVLLCIPCLFIILLFFCVCVCIFLLFISFLALLNLALFLNFFSLNQRKKFTFILFSFLIYKYTVSYSCFFLLLFCVNLISIFTCINILNTLLISLLSL